MAKNNLKRNRTRKSLIAIFAATAICCTGLAAACSPKDNDDEAKFAAKAEDTQLLKNGNFEFFDYPSKEYIAKGKAKYLIKNPDNWTRGGDSSNALSGIIGTGKTAWEELTAEDLKDKLSYNSDLSASDEKYVDYNGMKARDVLYKDTYAALLKSEDVEDSYIKNQTYESYFGITESDGKYFLGDNTEVYRNDEDDIEYYLDKEFTKPVRGQLIKNPGTHFEIKEENGAYYYMDGSEKVTVYKGEDGAFYTDEDLKYSCENVLMVHNYPTNSNYNGINQYYTSQSITLEANTAAEISVWVKTSDLKFDKGYSQIDDQDRGAFIEVVQSVGETSIDSFVIKSINTEKILADKSINASTASNGWLQYTVYVKSCDFATTSVQIRLGLGQSENSEKCTGYAFFDDVEITKHLTLEDKDCSYSDHKNEITAANTIYTLGGDKEDKIFIADKELRSGNNNYRHSKDFYYEIDLTSKAAGSTQIDFDSSVTAALTYEKTDGKFYASAENISDSLKSAVITVNKNNNGENYTLPKNLKNGIKTEDDLLGAFNSKNSDFAGSAYKNKLAAALTAEGARLPGYDGNMLVMLSAYGAAYTSTIGDISVEAEKSMIVSFWIKTSDMNGKTAATLKVTDKNDDKNSASFTVDSTGIKTEFEDNDDIYNGWVQCFMFINNGTDKIQNFKIDFLFGNTELAEATANSFNYGWAAMADLRTYTVDEEIYKLTAAGTHSVKFEFDKDDDEKSYNEFDSTSGIKDINDGYANASKYQGVNGGSSNVSDGDYSDGFDAKNTHKDAGLINREAFGNDAYAQIRQAIQNAFNVSDTDAVDLWNNVFGKDCYQPLIIINNLRTYSEKQTATAETFNNGTYYVEDENGTYEDIYGKKFRKVTESDTYDEDIDYYTLKDVVNYGYIGENATVSADSYATVSVRVKVSTGATAYVYLVDSATRKVLEYATPAYTFNYDEEGNVLNKELTDDMTEDEHKKAIVYTLRTDGLYNGVADGKIYANLYNLTTSYKYYKYEHNTFYDENGNTVSFDNLVDGENYYRDQNKNLADHFLCASDGTRVYEYVNGTYYYLVEDKDGKSVRGTAVTNFSDEYLRYSAPEENPKYQVKVENADDWVTVNFFIHTGSEALNYRVELWSGERGNAGDTQNVSGAVAFDYSAYSVTESNYATLLSEYENNIINEYKQVLKNNGLLGNIESEDANIQDYEDLIAQLIKDGKLTGNDNLVADKRAAHWYNQLYYTYTLYDSEAYVPFNADLAKEGETGYDYDASSYTEKLAYFTYKNESENSYNVFADYSAVDQKVELSKADSSDKDEDDNEDSSGEIWLLVSSIILVVALLFTLISILLRDAIKKSRRKKGEKLQSGNNYRQRKRYIKKLHLVENEDVTDGETQSLEPETVEPESETEENAENGSVESVEDTSENDAETETSDQTNSENKD